MPIAVTSTREIVARTGSASGLTGVAGNTIHYEVAGEGLPVVFLHDGLLHSLVFDAQFKAYSKSYTVIRYDRPGYGNSKPPAASYSEVETLKGLFDFLGLQTAILIGGSAGGRLALDFAIACPERVGALVLVGAEARGVEFDSQGEYRRGLNRWGEETVGQFIEFWAHDPWLVAEENRSARARLREILSAFPQNLADYPVEILDEAEARPHLSGIKVPVLVMVGEFDTADNHAHSGVIRNSIRNSEWQVVTHSGHLVYLEQPEKFDQLVLDFLERRVNKSPA
ncbi:MAG: alpha/beta hydrolase [Chloroflexi bacterium]|nr:alpha/beta hydrolase [Chloroflexota bacterium]